MIVPVKRYRATGRCLALPRTVVLASPRADDDLPLAQVAQDLRTHGCATRRIYDVLKPATLRIVRTHAGPPEGYTLEITPHGVLVRACTNAGVYYGLQTLRELLRDHGTTLPCAVITDAPAFFRRGVYLDCSRGKVPTLSTLCALVERLAHWKINELQLYIENVFAFSRHPQISRGFSPFTAEDIATLVAHCARHHVRLVPSLASFGHLETVLALPAYRHLAELPGAIGKPGGTTLRPTDPRSIRLIAEWYEEFLPLFPAQDFNVCCDETWELGQGRSRTAAERRGVGALYLEFLRKIHALCQRHGKRMNAWADIVLDHPDVLPQLPRDCVMLNWEYQANGPRIPRTKEIVTAGLACMVCPGTSGWGSHGTRLANAIANVAQFAAEGRQWKVEGLLMTDWGDGGHRNTLGVSLHGLAHAAAHAWHGAGVDDARFTETYCAACFPGCDPPRLAAAIRALGSVESILGRTRGRRCAPYYMIIEPFDPREDFMRGVPLRSPVRVPRAWQHSHADNATDEELHAVQALLEHDVSFPAPSHARDAFDRLTLAEYELAREMDLLAVRRGLLIRAVRAGKHVPATALRALAHATDVLARHFSRLWLARNRPSRLRDNLLLFQRAADDCRALAR